MVSTYVIFIFSKKKNVLPYLPYRISQVEIVQPQLEKRLNKLKQDVFIRKFHTAILYLQLNI